MKLRSEQLKKKSDEAGVSVEQLAEAVSRTGLKGENAISAVRNWMSGRDHPRARREDIERLSEVLGVLPKDVCRFTSEVRHHRGSPKKAKLIVDMIRGKSIDDALNALTFSTQRAAVNVKKALHAAISEAEQADADQTRLFVAESRVDKSVHIKRFQPKDRGRAHPILKRTSHITVGVQERA
ncbi:MAG: 50S ribosomal protein L22 [Phycisphaerales bacterium]